jgi:transcriptional regulator with XRE-family HTH domain
MNQNKAESLGEMVARIMDSKNLSSFDVERRSGNKINQSYVIKIKNGRVKNPSDEKKQALADGLGVTFEEVSAAARGIKLEASTFEEKLKLAVRGSEKWTDEQKDSFLFAVNLLINGIKID